MRASLVLYIPCHPCPTVNMMISFSSTAPAGFTTPGPVHSSSTLWSTSRTRLTVPMSMVASSARRPPLLPENFLSPARLFLTRNIAFFFFLFDFLPLFLLSFTRGPFSLIVPDWSLLISWFLKTLRSDHDEHVDILSLGARRREIECGQEVGRDLARGSPTTPSHAETPPRRSTGPCRKSWSIGVYRDTIVSRLS